MLAISAASPVGLAATSFRLATVAVGAGTAVVTAGVAFVAGGAAVGLGADTGFDDELEVDEEDPEPVLEPELEPLPLDAVGVTPGT